MWANQATPPVSAVVRAPSEAAPERSCMRNQKGRKTQAGT